MALVPAKCTQCGGNIEVDDTHEAGICQHCGTPFITEKAINNYTTNITNNIVNNNNFDGANVIIENDNLEQLNSRAETFMKLEEYTKAERVYREISEKYPNITEKELTFISSIDKTGYNFRYPTSYSLEYKIDDINLDFKNVYEYFKSIINFLDSCDSMLDAISEYENEMRSYAEW